MEPERPTDIQKSPPPLPERMLALPPMIWVGTGIWFVALCGLLVARYGFDVAPPIWLWTALAGTLLGLLGMPIMAWQRNASRRGNRGAQRNL